MSLENGIHPSFLNSGQAHTYQLRSAPLHMWKIPRSMIVIVTRFIETCQDNHLLPHCKSGVLWECAPLAHPTPETARTLFPTVYRIPAPVHDSGCHPVLASLGSSRYGLERGHIADHRCERRMRDTLATDDPNVAPDHDVLHQPSHTVTSHQRSPVARLMMLQHGDDVETIHIVEEEVV